LLKNGEDKMTKKASAEDVSLKLFVVLMKACKTVGEHAIRQVQSSGLNFTDFTILEILLNKGDLPISSIGAKLFLTNGSMTIAIDRLERKGLVERIAHRTDRRTKLVHLTKKGRQVINPIFREHAKAIQSATNGLKREEKELVVELVKRLGKYAEELPKEGGKLKNKQATA
jgi:MarR family 2-MHQ and catechol resistance regulon transcriptional repressor